MQKALLSFLTSFLITSSLFSQVPTYVPTSGLVGYWPFNGNANDESGNENHGTVNGATLTTDRNGNANSAYSFSNQTVSINHNTDLGISQSGGFSVSLWYLVTGNQNVQHLIGKRPNGAQQFNWQIAFNYPASQGINFGGNINFTDAGIVSDYTSTLNSWIHCIGTYDNGTWSLFFNGNMYASITSSLFYPDTNCPLTIGNSGSFQPFYGKIDDVLIYNRALSAEEVNALYTGVPYVPTVLGCTNTTACNYNASATQDDGSCTFPAQTYLNCDGSCINDANSNGICDEVETNLPSYLPANGLVAWYSFNGNANDESGNGNNGTVNGATLTVDRNGNANSAYSFDGVTNFIEASVNGLPISNNSRTISSWFKTSSNYNTNNVSPYQFINAINGYGSSSVGPVIFTQYIAAPDGKGYFETGSSQNQIFSIESVNNNSWHNMTCTYDQATMQVSMYIDGVFNSATTPINLETADSFFGIGKTPWYDIFFQGQIDDIAIYNRALTPTEITALYNGTTNNNSGNNNNTATTTVPAGISYQAVARNAQGTALANTAIQVKFTMITDSLSGTTEYAETHSLSTNSMGLFATAFGTGAAVSGTWAGINWTHSNKYLKVELDAGNGFVDLGTQQLLSSPFAIRAQSAATIENGALPVFADNAAAITGGLTVGKLYRTATGELKVVY